MTIVSRTKAISNTTGVSWMSVVISLLMLAFILYVFAAGSASVYYKLLFTPNASNPLNVAPPQTTQNMGVPNSSFNLAPNSGSNLTQDEQPVNGDPMQFD